MYRFNRSLYLTTTRVELIRVLSHHLAAKLFPWPEDLPRRNRHDGEDTLDWCQRAHHTPYSTPSRGGPLHRHGTYTWRDPGAAMAAPRTTGIAWQLRSYARSGSKGPMALYHTLRLLFSVTISIGGS